MKNFLSNHKNALRFLTLIFFVKLFTLLFLIQDRDWEPDSYMHFLQLRTLYVDFPNNLSLGLEVWSKPLFTFILAIPIYLFDIKEMIIIQIINLAIISLVSLIVYLIILKLQKNKITALVSLILTNLSFLLFRSSISALTEPIFLLFLVLGFYYFVNKRFEIASLMLGISVLGRIEGLFFLGVFNLWFIFQNLLVNKLSKKTIVTILKTGLIGVLPVLIWNFIGFLDSGNLFYIFKNGYPAIAGLYGFGTWLHFPKSLILHETLIIVLFILSTFIFFKNYKKQSYKNEYLLSFIFFIGFTFAQMYLWVLGQFGSAGLLRYLICVIPFAIIFSSIALEWILGKFKYKSLVVLTISLIQLCILFFHFFGVGPIESKSIYVEPELVEAGEWIKENIDNEIMIYSERPEVIYYSKRNGNLQDSAKNYKEKLLNKEQGIYIWSKDWGNIFGVSLNDLNAKAKFVKNFNNFIYIYRID